ncbi:OLC1v1015729C1 [Oldenlandia corymbosa var. corymbosa]|uniref:OLC1v1015729C1 n=1 Tax=Oldenlandia corymbosa var. corymbosa TaxID=529605 RepID=A0AAV1E668_OLDCO|nr:OLC1v1015729C1 [Oldenlandia corymbosa var. corymbosa]
MVREQPVYYECRPTQCNYYKNFGHRGEDYKKKISSEEAKTIEKMNQHKQKPVLSEWRIVQRGKGINVDEKLETPPPSNKSVITPKETIEKSREYGSGANSSRGHCWESRQLNPILNE